MKAKVKDYFRLIVFVNSVLCILSLIIMLSLCIIISELNKFQSDLYNTCDTVFKMSAGAFIGLLGGKSTNKQLPE